MDLYNFSEAQINYLQEINTNIDNNLSKYASKNNEAIRWWPSTSDNSLLRQPYSVDTDKILYNPLYNRYNDKTQVFSFYKNDDLTRRGLHVQLVSKIARTIGRALNLNLDLIESISLGHDIGHTPFGHKGEEFLSELYFEKAGKKFNHNVHSVHVFKDITRANLTLQSLDGILCHCGEKAFQNYHPNRKLSLEEFNEVFKSCYTDNCNSIIGSLRPFTLEGCVVRVSDIIAYIGKDRQDAYKCRLTDKKDYHNNVLVGNTNSEIITNVITNIVKNSINNNYLKMDKDVFDNLILIKNENAKLIYSNDIIDKPYYDIIKPMMKMIYEKLLDDQIVKNNNSVIFKHYLNDYIMGKWYKSVKSRVNRDKVYNDAVVDFIASMTDDYFIDLFKFLFPENDLNKEIKYHEYFEKL